MLDVSQDERIETREFSTSGKELAGAQLRYRFHCMRRILIPAIAIAVIILGSPSMPKDAYPSIPWFAGRFFLVIKALMMVALGLVALLLILVLVEALIWILVKPRKKATFGKWVFAGADVEYSNDQGERTVMPWSSLVKAEICGDWFILFATRSRVLWIPYRAFEPGDVDRLHALLAEKGLLKT
jgi:hypothetical protein